MPSENPEGPFPKGSGSAVGPSQKTASIRKDTVAGGSQNRRNTIKETPPPSMPTEGAIEHADDVTSTADEEDIPGPPLKAMKLTQTEPNPTINPGLLQVSGDDPQPSKTLLEVPSTPEPMELDSNSQGRGLKRKVERSARVAPNQRRANVSTVSSGVYVGCESE